MRILDLAIKDLKQIMRDWKSALFIVLMPIVFTLFFGWIFQTESQAVGSLPLAYPQTAAGHPGQREFIKLLGMAETVQAQAVAMETEASFEGAIREGDFAAALLFAPDFEARLRAGDTGLTLLVADANDPAAQSVMESVETVVERYQSSLDIADLSAQTYTDQMGEAEPDPEYRDAALALAVASWQDPPIRLRTVMGSAGAAEVEMGFNQSSPGMIVQFAVFGLITSAMVLVLERKSGAMKRLLTSPLKRVELIGGHVLAMFILVFLQQLVLILLGEFAFGVSYSQAPLAVVIMMIALAFWAASLGLFIGAIAKTEEQVVTISLIAMFLFASLGGAWFPLEFAGQAFSTIGHFTPTAWAMDGYQNMLVRGMGLNSVLIPAGLLVAYGLVFFGLAVWRFRYE
jgi:ABC-2 type transport system permease protein